MACVFVLQVKINSLYFEVLLVTVIQQRLLATECRVFRDNSAAKFCEISQIASEFGKICRRKTGALVICCSVVAARRVVATDIFSKSCSTKM